MPGGGPAGQARKARNVATAPEDRTVVEQRQPRSPPAERRKIILEAAAEVFFEHGYAAASIDMIIERIGGSKRTIYNEFGNKDALFTALVTELADENLARFERVQDSDADLRSKLVALARSLLDIYTSRHLVGIYRVIVMEAARFPKLARSIYDRGPGRATEKVRIVLEEAQEQGALRDIDLAEAADHFVGMMRDNLHLQLVLGLRAPPNEREAQHRATSAVDMFLGGVLAPRPAGSRPASNGPRRRAPAGVCRVLGG